jgi:hypothetical protein
MRLDLSLEEDSVPLHLRGGYVLPGMQETVTQDCSSIYANIFHEKKTIFYKYSTCIWLVTP